MKDVETVPDDRATSGLRSVLKDLALGCVVQFFFTLLVLMASSRLLGFLGFEPGKTEGLEFLLVWGVGFALLPAINLCRLRPALFFGNLVGLAAFLEFLDAMRFLPFVLPGYLIPLLLFATIPITIDWYRHRGGKGVMKEPYDHCYPDE